mmetsp:Transcript_28295/g.48810  ORF Transcript_28295/g.48810 Transcript_28295/m.48810 type:complete len:234 (+) Transcript_28295:291-992(+)
MHLNRTIQSIIIMSSLHQSPAFNVEFLLDTCRAHGPFSIPDNVLVVRFFAVDCTIIITCCCFHRLVNQPSTNIKTLRFNTSTIQRGQRPCIQRIHPSLRLLHQYRRMGQSTHRISLTSPTQQQCFPSSHSPCRSQIRSGQSQQICRKGGVQSVPRLGLSTMQHPILSGVRPIARCIIPQIAHHIDLMRRRIARHLIDGRAGQCHQCHLGQLEVDFLGVPFGGYGQCEGEGGEC